MFHEIPHFSEKNIQEMDPTEMEQADDEFSVERVLDKRVRFFKCPNMESDCLVGERDNEN